MTGADCEERIDENFFPGHAGPGDPHNTRSALLLPSRHLATDVLEPSGAHPPPSHAYPHNQEQAAARGRADLGRDPASLRGVNMRYPADCRASHTSPERERAADGIG